MDAPVITLLTDFGSRDAYAGIMKGVILGICPRARLVDLTHEVPPQDVRAGALVLRSAAPYFPARTIHVAVVDPGVGSARTPILIETAAAWFVGPDNGLLHPAASALGIRRVLALTNAQYHRSPASSTFHGRDVFAPVAAHLATGVDPALLGIAHGPAQALALPAPHTAAESVDGEVIYVDRFGNLITNIGAGDLTRFSGTALSVSIGTTTMALARTYADVPPGNPVALLDSWGQLEIAVRDGDAAKQLRARTGVAVTVRRA